MATMMQAGVELVHPDSRKSGVKPCIGAGIGWAESRQAWLWPSAAAALKLPPPGLQMQRGRAKRPASFIFFIEYQPRAATPGNSLPSIHSRKAPPAVEI